jgi:lysophospholipase L1-like esterase
MRAQQENRRSQFATAGAREGHIVFLGDSISEGGLWNEWFPDVPILNRGIAGETTDDVLGRLDTAVARPLAVFLLIGTNDIQAGRSAAFIVANLTAILDGIEQRAPGTPVFVQGIMPTAAGDRDQVVGLNRQIVASLAGSPDHIRYLDLWPALATEDGSLNPDFTIDNLHLNGDGYKAWVDVLRPYVFGVLDRTHG